MIAISSPAQGSSVAGRVTIQGVSSQAVGVQVGRNAPGTPIVLPGQSFRVQADVSACEGPIDLIVTNTAGESASVLVIANVSIDGMTVPPGAKIIDSIGNRWRLEDGIVTKNGFPVVTGSPTEITELVYWGSSVYGHNDTGWLKNTSMPWAAAADPRPPAASVLLTSPVVGAVPRSCVVAGKTNQMVVTIKDGTTVLATVIPAADGTFSREVKLVGTGSRVIHACAGTASASVTVTVI